MQKSFQAWLTPGFEPFRFDYNADRLEALAEERASEWTRVGKADFLTLDEQREAVGYGPVPKDAFFAKRDAALERRYSPDQPRAPAGSPDGGQWKSGGGRAAGDQVAMNVDPNVASDAGDSVEHVGYTSHVTGRVDFLAVDLIEEEAQGGHAIARHVGRTKEQLIARANRNRVGFGKMWNL